MIYDVAVVGAGIVGLAHALAAARRGKRVLLLERDARANGASIRNFGFVTVTGQQAGDCWQMARRSRVVWQEVAEAAAIPILQRGLLVTARRPEAEAVIGGFLRTDMAAGCRRLSAGEARAMCPALGPDVTAALHSPHELRVESRDALPGLAAWLAEAHGVTFHWLTAVHAVETPRIQTSRGLVEAESVVVCPGDDISLFAGRLAAYGLTRCQLQMLRIAPGRRIALGTAVMSDLGLARYLGYAELPEARALQRRLDAEQAEHRAHGVHLIAVESADGSLVVGDSHHACAHAASRSARPPATRARSWRGCCRSPPRRATRRTTWSAPTICPRGGRGRFACTSASSRSRGLSAIGGGEGRRYGARDRRGRGRGLPDRLLRAAGADHVIDTVADLPDLLEPLRVEPGPKAVQHRSGLPGAYGRVSDGDDHERLVTEVIG